MFIPALLAARGPISALTILVSTATFSAGAFFVALRNTALDCPRHSATNAACGVDILTHLVTFIAAAGATAGATFIGLTNPTPCDSPVFRVDGVDFNHTSSIQRYITYEKDGYLHKRLDTRVDIPDPSGKRALCRAYYDTRFWSDDLRTWEYRADIGEDLFYQFVNREWKARCVWFRGNKAATGGIYEASFELGASCSQEEPAYLNCGKATYNVEVAGFNF
ncbi:hypothetical protein FOMG_00065 [Fusarium oxysporum f. sp. melonis 26406]|uniref:Uncharacterized protein n=1 Tax=Fusarium oxysporum f. sp. melonis 26406 TaxID=1089452 RepID=X0BMY0_FUSOX|nr:hypothetical protein FOMG_00065 [Fusarium oxysporum f. sp. melonis 26406]